MLIIPVLCIRQSEITDLYMENTHGTLHLYRGHNIHTRGDFAQPVLWISGNITNLLDKTVTIYFIRLLSSNCIFPLGITVKQKRRIVQYQISVGVISPRDIK